MTTSAQKIASMVNDHNNRFAHNIMPYEKGQYI